MKAVILAGGLAKRLRPVTEEIPKTLVEVAGKPVLEWELAWLRKIGYDQFLILAGNLGEKIEAFIASRPDISQGVKVIIEREPLGTGGAIKNASAELQNDSSFALVNGDSITDMKISKATLGENGIATICLSRYRIPKGVVKFKGDVITSFVEKPVLKNCWISTGIYILSNEILQHLPDKGSIEEVTFPKLLPTGRLKCKKFPKAYFNATETMKDVEQISKDIQEGLYKP